MLNKIQSIFKEFKKPYTSKVPVNFDSRLYSIITKNRETLEHIPNWLKEDTRSSSYFNYGVPDDIFPLLDLNINNDITYTDLIAYCSNYLKSINYLELGVSVGKNFLQLANQFENAELTGFDIENINPTIEGLFEPNGSQSWATMDGSIRKESSFLNTYKYKSNHINYLAGDIWDEDSWAKLKGKKFNLIFSDALHDHSALLWEYEMIKKFELLDKNFIFFWDDLNHGLEDAFFKIALELKNTFSLRKSNIRKIKINGWLGNNYPLKHDVGIISNLF
jgi:hypothetical protein